MVRADRLASVSQRTLVRVLRRDTWKAIVLVACVAVMYLREPSFFLEPRFWAEEAYYFEHAHRQASYASLLDVARIRWGYFMMWPAISATLAAKLAPLSEAPLVTTCMALAVQIVPLTIILWSNTDLWQGNARKAVGLLAILLVPLSGEVWLNTINSQFYFALITFLILLEGTNLLPAKKWFYRVLLLLAGVTGLVSLLLLPLFLFRAWIDRERERTIQVCVLLATAATQVVAMFLSSPASGLSGRLAGINLVAIPAILWVHTTGLLLTGLNATARVADAMITSYQADNIGFHLGTLALLIVQIVILWFLSIRQSPRWRVVLVGGYLSLALVPIVAAVAPQKISLLSPGQHERYFFVPNVILMLLILSNFRPSVARSGTWQSAVYAGAIVIVLVLGAVQYRSSLLNEETWPRWRSEVTAWREVPDKVAIEVWPPGWRIYLGDVMQAEMSEGLTLVRIYREEGDASLLMKLLWATTPDRTGAWNAPYTVVVRIVDERGDVVAASEQPMGQANPALRLRSSYHRLVIKPELPPGPYRDVIRVYSTAEDRAVDVGSVVVADRVVSR